MDPQRTTCRACERVAAASLLKLRIPAVTGRAYRGGAGRRRTLGAGPVRGRSVTPSKQRNRVSNRTPTPDGAGSGVRSADTSALSGVAVPAIRPPDDRSGDE